MCFVFLLLLLSTPIYIYYHIFICVSKMETSDKKTFNAKVTPQHKCKKETWFFVSNAPPRVTQNSHGHPVIQSKRYQMQFLYQNKYA